MIKKKLCIWGLFAMLLSCSYELDSPPPFNETSLKRFNVTEARRYFEENATDLSFLRFTGPPPAETRSGMQDHPELIPEWSRAVQSENKEATLIEVPIRSDITMLSTVCQFENGKFRFSKTDESRSRLIIARRKDGLTKMFVATLIPSSKYPNKEEDMENFRYLGGGNFTGKVFCSMLDGCFVEASQYVNGHFIGMLNITTRKELAQRGESLANESYESVMLSSVAQMQSSAYAFDEGGGGSTSKACPFHPQYSASNCPYCLEEVIIRYCQHCGTRLEEGEVCNCRCVRCGYYPCRCCPNCHSYPCNCRCIRCGANPCVCCTYCHNKPCTCASTCNICRPNPCTICSKCKRHFCFGTCENTDSGNEGSGNTEANESTGDTHTIDSTDVIANQNVLKIKRRRQKGNTCVPQIMEYINQLLDLNDGNNRRTYIMYFKEQLKKSSMYNKNIKAYGVPTIMIPRAMISLFGDKIIGDISYGSYAFDYKTHIDAGNVIMTNIQISDNIWHNILIIGHTKKGNYIYIDPNDNNHYYIRTPIDLQSNSEYKYNFEIKLKK